MMTGKIMISKKKRILEMNVDDDNNDNNNINAETECDDVHT